MIADSSPLMTTKPLDSLDWAESPYPDISLSISKREYLLAQIRQKDAIIESLLKQVRLRTLAETNHAHSLCSAS